MGNWFVEVHEFSTIDTQVETFSRELVAGPFDSYNSCLNYCQTLVTLAVENGNERVSPTCYTGAKFTGNLFSLRPESEEGHKYNLERDRFKASAKALATWARDVCPNPKWITDILGENERMNNEG